MPAIYYRDSAGAEPVNDFIDALPEDHQLSIDSAIDLLNRVRPSDPPLPFPHSSQVDGPLRELRCHHGRVLYRVLYRRSGNLFILLHMIRKNTGALPDEAIGNRERAMGRFSREDERAASPIPTSRRSRRSIGEQGS